MRKHCDSSWTTALLDEVTDRGSGHTPSQSHPSYWNGGIKWVSLTDSDRLDCPKLCETTKHISVDGLNNSSAVLHKPGTVIMSRDADVGRCGVLGEEMAVSQHFLAWECAGKGKLHNYFLYYWLQQRKPVFERIAVGSTIKTIGLPYFKKLTISFPIINEQRKIAEILQTWDEAIEACERLVNFKKASFDLLALRVLSGRRRLGRSTEKWKPYTLTDVTSEITTRNAGRLGPDTVMGVNKSLGMIPMKEHVRAEDLSRYKIVSPNAFAYNPMRLNIGSIARNLHGSDVLASPDYVAFQVKPDLLLAGFFDHLRRTSKWSLFVKDAGSGGVRVRIYYDDLTDFVLELPPVEEQARIVEILDVGRREISLLEQKRAALMKQKRGLMQKLLTGEWRVKVAKEAAA